MYKNQINTNYAPIDSRKTEFIFLTLFFLLYTVSGLQEPLLTPVSFFCFETVNSVTQTLIMFLALLVQLFSKIIFKENIIDNHKTRVVIILPWIYYQETPNRFLVLDIWQLSFCQDRINWHWQDWANRN